MGYVLAVTASSHLQLSGCVPLVDRHEIIAPGFRLEDAMPQAYSDFNFSTING
jgi:hypothetical protein